MKALLKKQVDYLKVISDNTTKDTLLQEAQIALEIKTDKDIREDDKKNREELLDIKEAIKEGLISTTGDGVNSNVIRLSEMVKNLTTEVKSANDDTFAKEKALESDRREEQSLKQQEEQNGLLQKLLNAFKEGFKKPGDTKLEGLGTGLAIALGALAGAVQGYVKAIIDMNKFLARGVGKMFESLFKLLPESVKTSLSTALKLVTDSVKSVVDGAVARLSKVFTFLTEAASKQLTKVVQFISDVPFKVMTLVDDLLLKLPPKIGGPIIQFIDDAAKWITSAGKWVLDIPKKIISFFSGFTPLLKTIEEGSGPITKLVTFVKETFGKVVSGVKETFGKVVSGFKALGSKLSVFSNMFGAVAKVVQKIAYPLTIIMAVWDTVKGAIEGYEKEGIVGAIKGAITGLFNSLIGGLLDMVKSGISWIAGKLGFTEVEKALDSFSFQDLFKNVIDSIFGFVGSIGDWISKKIESVKNFFGFGIDDKKKAAKDRLSDSKKSLKTAETAASIGAIGIDDQGNTSAAISLVNGMPDREGAAQEVQSQGYRLMTDDEKKSYLDKKNKDVMDAEKALADIENIPTLSKIWEDFKFGDAIKNMIASAFGTIPDLIKNAGSWIAGKLGFTEVEKLLDSFSFTDLYIQAMDSVIDLVESIGKWIGDKISSIGDWVSDKFNSVKKFFGFGDKKEKDLKEVKDVFTKTAADRTASADEIKKFKEENGLPDAKGDISNGVAGRYVHLTDFDWKGNATGGSGRDARAGYKDQKKQEEYAKLLQKEHTANSMQGSALEEYGNRKDDIKYASTTELMRFNKLSEKGSFKNAGLTTTIENSKKMIAALTERGGVEAGTIEVPDNKEQYKKLKEQYLTMNYKALQKNEVASDDSLSLSKIWEDFKFGDAIKNMIASTFGTIPDMLKDAASWIAGELGFTKVQEYLDSFSFTQTFSDIIDAITNPMDTLERLFGTIGDGINEYVLQPIENMFNDVKTLFEDNVTKPLKKHFEPISKFFSDVQKKMMSMLEDFGIPKVSFTIPIINQEVSIGPFYPFRPKAGTTRIATDTKLTQTSSSESGSSSRETNKNIVAAGTHYEKDGTLSKDKTQVLTKSSSESRDKESGVSSRQFSKAYAEFDPETGKATLSRTSAEGRESKSISMRAFRKIKQNAEAGGTTAEVDAIVKEDEAYQQLSFLDKRKVDAGLAEASQLLKLQKESEEKEKSKALIVNQEIIDPEASLIQSSKLESVNNNLTQISEEERQFLSSLTKEDREKYLSSSIVTENRSTSASKLEISKDQTSELSIAADPEASLIQSASVQAPAPYDSTAVYERSKKNEDVKAEVKSTVTPVIVNAPTTNVSNNKQSITIPQPVRNDDKDLFNYNMSRSAFIS